MDGKEKEKPFLSNVSIMHNKKRKNAKNGVDRIHYRINDMNVHSYVRLDMCVHKHAMTIVFCMVDISNLFSRCCCYCA